MRNFLLVRAGDSIMKIEKFGSDRIKVTVSPVELDDWNINPKAISPDSPQLREFIASLIAQSCGSTGVELMGSNILVEARPQGDDFVFVITRVSPEFESMRRQIARSLKKQKLLNGQYKIKRGDTSESEYFIFNTLADFAYMLRDTGCKMFSDTTLYRYENKFCLELRKSSSDYQKCLCALSEYASCAKKGIGLHLSEHAEKFAGIGDYDAIMRIYV